MDGGAAGAPGILLAANGLRVALTTPDTSRVTTLTTREGRASGEFDVTIGVAVRSGAGLVGGDGGSATKFARRLTTSVAGGAMFGLWRGRSRLCGLGGGPVVAVLYRRPPGCGSGYPHVLIETARADDDSRRRRANRFVFRRKGVGSAANGVRRGFVPGTVLVAGGPVLGRRRVRAGRVTGCGRFGRARRVVAHAGAPRRACGMYNARADRASGYGQSKAP